MTAPKPGKPFGGGIQGQPALRAELPADLVAKLLQRLRRYPPRGGNRLRIYVDDVEQPIGNLDGHLYPDDDEAPAAGVEVAAPVSSEVLDRRAEIQRLDQRVRDEEQRLKETRARVDAAVKVYEDRLTATMSRCEAQTVAALEHHRVLRENFWQMDVRGQGIYLEQAGALDESMRKVLAIRQTRDELLGTSGVAAWIELGRALMRDFEDSTIGQAVGLQASAAMSGVAAKIMGMKNADGADYTSQDALAAMIKEGRAFRERKQAIARFAANRPRCMLSQAAAMALKIIEGEADLKTLAELVTAHDAGDAK